jgi:superfamily II DNA or RNA helicase
MSNIEFIIVLTRHRHIGNVFLPYLISRNEEFYSVETLVKSDELDAMDYNFHPYEKKLVEITEKYSDNRLMKKFSRLEKVTDFFSGLETVYFEKHILPFIDQCMFEVAGILMVSPVRLFRKQSKYSNLHPEDEIYVQPFFARPLFFFERTKTETLYKLKIFINDKEIHPDRKKTDIITNKPCLIIQNNRLIAFEKLDSKKITPFLDKEYISIPHSMEERYYSGFLRKVVRDFEVEAKGFRITDGSTDKRAALSLEHNLQLEPCLVLYFYYGDECFIYNSPKKITVQFIKKNSEYIFKKIVRDPAWEENILEKLTEYGLQQKNGFFTLPGTDIVNKEDILYSLINWINRHKPDISEKGIDIKQGKLEKRYFTGEQHLTVKPEFSGDWFDVHGTVTFGEFSFPFIRLKKYILNDIHEFELPDGETAIIPDEWFARYKSLMPFAHSHGGSLRFRKNHYPLIMHILQPGDKFIAETLNRLSGNGISVKLPGKLNATLRDYQKEGYNWMFKLHKNGFGGCLADDMGLGKTLQTLALLLKLKPPEPVATRGNPVAKDGQLELFTNIIPENTNQTASLIVVPASLVHNWEAEIDKFTPSLKVYRHVGQLRKKDSDLERAVADYDIILTTYGTIRNDAGILSGNKLFYLILDESQYIKNPSSKTYKAIMKLSAQHRLVLTGTPIENSLSDLWAQMNFLNRGLLGNLAFFRRYFITPVEMHSSEDQQGKLRIMIRPFILRRTKEEVARDLPPLMEQVIICEMDKKQKQKYEIEKSIIRNSILEKIEKDGVKRSSMIILRGLTRLRQLANHPLLLGKDMGKESGKMEEIFRILENLVAENHKVLIFSSFVKHLELLRERLIANGWKYSMLTGQTTMRSKVIDDFQNDPEKRIFLISLKAGGVGLNLTSADYVFIVDPWWNPAAENQAVSRAHRIGQNKHVFVYRFITQDSIEEKIQLLQNRKSSLSDKFINSNNPLQEITKEEMISLFK